MQGIMMNDVALAADLEKHALCFYRNLADMIPRNRRGRP
jgi:hypothetical protein